MLYIICLLMMIGGCFFGMHYAVTKLGVALCIVMFLFMGHAVHAVFFTRQHYQLMKENGAGMPYLVTLFAPLLSFIVGFIIIKLGLKFGHLTPDPIVWAKMFIGLAIWAFGGSVACGFALGALQRAKKLE